MKRYHFCLTEIKNVKMKIKVILYNKELSDQYSRNKMYLLEINHKLNHQIKQSLKSFYSNYKNHFVMISSC